MISQKTNRGQLPEVSGTVFSKFCFWKIAHKEKDTEELERYYFYFFNLIFLFLPFDLYKNTKKASQALMIYISISP